MIHNTLQAMDAGRWVARGGGAVWAAPATSWTNLVAVCLGQERAG